ncbi:MAG: transposase [Candidatus Azotimanducaceae bacterium]
MSRSCCTSQPVDFHKAVDGLAVIVEETLEQNPFSGTLFVFVNRNRGKVKILYWERNGFVMWYNRLEKERFLWPDKQGEVVTLNGQQLNWMVMISAGSIHIKKYPHYPCSKCFYCCTVLLYRAALNNR